MNPAQYRKAMQQRALDRRAELERAEARPQRNLGATHPPSRDSSHAARAGHHAAVVVPKAQLHGDDSEGGSAATSFASAAAGGGSVGGLSDHDQLGDRLLHSTEDGLSPLAPGPLAYHWGDRDAQLAGFDRQADLNRNSNSNSDSSGAGSGASPGEVWGEKDGELGFVGQGQRQQQQQQWRRRRQRGVRVLDWGDKLPGETSITQSVRLYLSNLYQDASHEDNCALFLHQILERVAREELDLLSLKTRHIVKIEAFLRSVVLSVPARTWQQSVRGAFARTAPSGITTTMTSSMSPGHDQQTQITKEELTFRMTLFVAMIKAERTGTDEADVVVDALRVESVVRGYAANAAEILPLQRPARTLLPPLLFCMACEVLHVRLLAPEVRHVCRQIVSDYEARAKLWMSPAQNTQRFLLPLVTEFASWLRANRDILYQGSATEGLLRSVDQHLRSSLKNQVYRSPEHFLEVLQSLSHRLTDMPLPSYDPSGGDDHPFDISQTLKDVSRERFEVNKEPTDPSRCWSRIRALLLDAAVEISKQKQKQKQQQRQAPAPLDGTPRPADAAALQPDTGGARIATDSPAPAAAPPVRMRLNKGAFDAAAAAEESKSPPVGEGEERRRSGPLPGADPDTSPGDAVEVGGLGSESSGGTTGKLKGGSEKSEVDARGEGCACGGGGDGDVAEEPASACFAKSPVEVYVDQCAWRVLHAASRTASGGDSFFVVQDLFGGEGVLVKMATATTEPIRIRTKGLAVRVTTVDKHDIYHISDVDMSTEDSPRPLMTITTTMKEIIKFEPPPFVYPTSARHKSGPTAEEVASGSANSQLSDPIRRRRQQQQQQQQHQQPSHARSGRFITISAELPNYPEDHLDATAGVLQANLRASSVASMSDMEPAPNLQPQAVNAGTDQGDAEASPADSDAANGAASTISSGNKVLHRRPSVFNSPPPAATPAEWKRLFLEMQSVDSSRSGCSPAGSRLGEGEWEPAEGDGDSTSSSNDGAAGGGR